MNIAPAGLKDAPDIARVHVRSWQTAYAHILAPEFLSSMSVEVRTARWHEILMSCESETLMAAGEDGIATGFISYGDCRDEGAPAGQGEIWALYVEPGSWRKGVGRALMDQALRALRRAGKTSASLWVLSENHSGRRFYESLGFHPVPLKQKQFELGGRLVGEICLKLELNHVPMEDRW